MMGTGRRRQAYQAKKPTQLDIFFFIFTLCIVSGFIEAAPRPLFRLWLAALGILPVCLLFDMD